jgi:hypothetical protein
MYKNERIASEDVQIIIQKINGVYGKLYIYLYTAGYIK